MSVWTEDAVPVRRSSRRLSVTASDLESAASSSAASTFSTPAKETQRKLMLPKSSLIPRLKPVEEKMASSDDDVLFVPSTEQKRGRGRPRKNSPARPKMTAIKTPASSAAAVKEAAAAATPAATAARKEKTPPRSRSSSRTRRAAAAAATPTTTPTKTAAALPKIAPVLNFDDTPVMTRRSTRLAATKTPATNGHANGSSVHHAAKDTPAVGRFSTEVWREEFTERHPFLTKIFIPAMICLVYAAVILAVCVYFNVHKKAPQWFDMAAKSLNDMYDDFMARRAAASAAAAADSEEI